MKITSWWRRLDRHILELTIGVALLGVGLATLLPLLAVAGVIPAMDTREVTIGDRAQVPNPASAGMSLRGTHQAELAVSDPDLWDRILLAGPQIVWGVLTIVVLTLLMRMAETFRADGDVFVPRNTHRLYGIALTLILIATVGPALDALATIALVSGTPLEPAVNVTYTLSPATLLLGILVAALAGAFGHGARLRADTEGLV